MQNRESRNPFFDFLDKGSAHNLEAELAVIGGALLDREAADLALERLTTEDFYREAHKTIFSTMVQLSEAGQAVDLVTLAESLRSSGRLDACGGAAHLCTCLDSVPTSANQEYYINILIEKTKIRRMMYSLHDFGSRLEKTQGKPDDLKAALMDTVLSDLTDREPKVERPLSSVFDEIYTEAGSRLEDVAVDGVSIGYSDVDYLTYGLRDGELIIVAARPSMGKTQFALCAACNIAEGPDPQRVAVFSIEMSKHSIGIRLLSYKSGVSQRTIRLRVPSPREKDMLAKATQELSRMPLDVYDCTSGLTPAILRRKLGKMEREGKLPRVVFIDYLQLMSGGGNSFNRNEEMDKVSRELKRIAEEFSLPIVVMAQLNREVEKRSDKRPVISDLRESGGIENHADQVWLIHIPAYYWKNKPNPNAPWLAEIIIGKDRNGEVGVAQIACIRATARFYQPDERELLELIRYTEEREEDERKNKKDGKGDYF